MSFLRDEDGNRPGSWINRGGRTRQTANQIIKDPNEKKWYLQTFWVVFFLLFFWPVGIVLMFKTTWPVPVKIIACVLVAIMVYFAVTMQQAVQGMA